MTQSIDYCLYMKYAKMDNTVVMNKAGAASLVVAMLFFVFAVGVVALTLALIMVELVVFDEIDYFMCTASTSRKRPKQTFAYMTVFVKLFS